MKATFVVFFALVAVAYAGVVSIPSTLSVPYSSQYTALGRSYEYPLTYAASPYAYVASPYAYAAAPIAYSAPVTYTAPAAVQSGYVAATRGSVHTAPLPEGPFAFSHHINTAPAPGTL